MESEENNLKCISCFPRQGKKYLFGFILINILIILYVYTKMCIPKSAVKSSYEDIKKTFPRIQDGTLFHIPLLNTNDMAPFYVEVSTNTWCFQHATDILESKKKKKCICDKNWFGLDCGIPEAVWKSQFMQEGKNAGVEIRRRDKPRRILYSVIVDDEYNLLDIAISNMFSFVDVFLIIQEKKLNVSLSTMFKEGFLTQYQHKIMLFLYNETSLNIRDKYNFLMSEAWEAAWKKLTDFRPDDLLLFSHATCIFSEDVLLFLKFYDGYPEPFTFNFRIVLFKFSNEIVPSKIFTNLLPFSPSGCSFQFITSMCGYEIKSYLKNFCFSSKKKAKELKHWQLHESAIGNTLAPSGWQCIMCFKFYGSVETSFQKWLTDHIRVSILSSIIKNDTLKEFFTEKNSAQSSLKLKSVQNDNNFFVPKSLYSLKQYFYLLE